MKTCFFSHNWDDDKDDFILMLKEAIIKLSHSEIKVILDKDDFSLADNLDHNENIIKTSTSVVVFLSPNYKKCVDEKNESKGTYREYKKILSRMGEGSDFLIPVLIAGNPDKSVPDEIKKIIYQDATKYNAFFDVEDSYFRSRENEEIEKIALSIINITNLLYKINSQQFKNSVEAANELIHNTHANGRLPNNCMVLTDAYTQIINQESFIFTGRKGSGKTTLKELIENYDPRNFLNNYKTLYPIVFDSMNIQYLLDLYEEISSKCGNLFRHTDILKIFWELFFTYSAMLVVTKDFENNRINDTVQRNRIQPLYNEIKGIFEQDSLSNVNTEAIFTLTRDSISEQFKRINDKYIENAKLNTILTANLNAVSIAKSTITNNLFASFCNIVERCQKKIMLFVDGFDTYADDFWKASKAYPTEMIVERNKRELFETDFYKVLINVVNDIKENRNKSHFSNTHFCIMLPENVLERVKQADRDFIKKKVSVLRWDARYLVDMVNRRLLAINSMEDSKNQSFDLFKAYMNKFYPQIPMQYRFRFNNREINIDLFNYFLSLSFWRPRDILTHLGYLIGAIDTATKDMLSERTLRALLLRSSEDIIEKEFFNEYASTIYNLQEILFAFEGKNIVLTANDCYKTINSKQFSFASKDDDQDFESKMRFLYEIGFIGVILPPEQKARYEYATEYCFIFNEGIRPFELINFDSDLSNTKFIINHLFYNYLNLNYNSEVFIEEYSEDYYISNHQTRKLINSL